MYAKPPFAERNDIHLAREEANSPDKLIEQTDILKKKQTPMVLGQSASPHFSGHNKIYPLLCSVEFINRSRERERVHGKRTMAVSNYVATTTWEVLKGEIRYGL